MQFIIILNPAQPRAQTEAEQKVSTGGAIFIFYSEASNLRLWQYLLIVNENKIEELDLDLACCVRAEDWGK